MTTPDDSCVENISLLLHQGGQGVHHSSLLLLPHQTNIHPKLWQEKFEIV